MCYYSVLIIQNTNYFRLLARASARFNNANLASIPVYNTSGELKHLETKQSFVWDIEKLVEFLKMMPEKLDDPQDHKRYCYFMSYQDVV